MKDSLSLYNRDDFRQRYKNSFGFLPVDNKKTLVFIKDVTSSKVVFQTESNGMDYYANAGAGVEFEFLPITRSWYDLGDKPALLYRVPARQYCRGINSNNTSCRMPDIWGELSPTPLTLEILNKVFVTPSVPDISKFLSKEKNFFVLGRTFCLYSGKVYFFSKPIGTYSGKEITINNPLVYQEMLDIMVRRSLPFTIKVDHANS